MPEEQGKSRRKPPPEAHRFKPGQSGNPAGRKTLGATVKEWLNSLRLASDAKLKRIADSARYPSAKRAAAEQILHMRMARMAAYERLVNGTATLEDLERDGIDTSLVKKVKERQELDARGNVVAVTREIELHNVAGEAFDRVCQTTDGRPAQAVHMTGDVPQAVAILFPTLPARSE